MKIKGCRKTQQSKLLHPKPEKECLVILLQKSSQFLLYFLFKLESLFTMGIGNMLVLSQVTGYTLIFMMAFFVFIPMAVNKAEFSDHCLLHASGQWVSNSTAQLTLDISKWGDIGSCNFPIFVAVASLPVALGYCALLSVDLFKNTEP